MRDHADNDVPDADDGSAFEEMPLRELAGRTVTGSLFNLISQGMTLILGFVRSVLLARILYPSDFGIVALALVFVNLITSIATFGLNAALIQRKTAEPEAISTHFVMRMGLMLASLLITALCIPLLNHFYPDRPQLVPIVLALSATAFIGAVSSTPSVLLQRRMAFRRLAVLDVLSSATMLAVAVPLAQTGLGPWSLVLGEQLTGTLVSAAGVWLYRPPWRLSFTIDRTVARQYVHFGRYILVNNQLNYILDRFDDFWTATVLGSAAAGFYSKAYEFARYPRRIISGPLQPVFFAAYSRLQDDRLRLSQAYFRLNSLVVRLGFLLALVLELIAPEFVELLLTAKWLPMVNTFRLMIVYTLLDPLVLTAGNLAVAMGQPQILTRIKVLQLAIFLPAVILFASLWDIEGVALAADIMLLVGIGSILRQVRRFVDFSIRRLFAYPALALIVGGAVGLSVGMWIGPANLWLAMLGKAASASAAYAAILLIFERDQYQRNLDIVLGMLGLRQLGRKIGKPA